MEPVHVARMLKAGASTDEVARIVTREHGLDPITAVKLMRNAGVDLAEGKRAVDGALPPLQRDANERLRAIAIEAVSGDADKRSVTPGR